tara:strand:+ start:286 stop:498 length:213 start_codon:yes stop_codon:yes gene_type:complete
MKVELKEVEKKGFKPFKIELTIETLAELKNLHNRLNIASYVVNESLGNYWAEDSIELFNVIDNELLKDRS